MRKRPEVTGVVVGVGLSSAATCDEVRALVRRTLERHGLGFPPAVIATRAVFVDDSRLQLGCPVVGFDDDLLVARSGAVERSVGLAARVAETAAALAAGVPCSRVSAADRTAHATAAVAIAAPGEQRA